jgi:predicted alpha/beta hydrolase family esterase
MKIGKVRKQVYVVHGYNASPTSHWFPWMKEKLSEKGVAVDILKMPNSSEPNLDAWTRHLSRSCELNDDSFFIAHSLGTITLLRYLEQAEGKERIGGFLLVSGFSKPLPELSLLDEFTRDPLDFDSIVNITSHRLVLASRDDPIVPFTYSKELAERIRAEFHQVEKCGHFLGIEGFTTLPIVYDLVSKAMGLDP